MAVARAASGTLKPCEMTPVPSGSLLCAVEKALVHSG